MIIFEHKVLNICKSINLTVENSDIEGSHTELDGKGDPKTTIVRFVITLTESSAIL